MQTQDTPRFLTGPEVRARLQIDSAQLYGLAHRQADPLPHLRVGNAYRIPLAALLEWEKRNTKGAVA